LPLDLGMKSSEAAYRVLAKLCDAHHDDTGAAYRDVPRMAHELGCSARTVQRGLRQLEQAGLIVRGDQQLLPGNMRRDHAPTVYVLPLDRWQPPAEQPQLDGVTQPVTPPGPVDNSSRGDRHAVDGVTAAVALGTGEQIDQVTEATTDRARCPETGGRHEFSRRYGTCVYCGERKPA
jgi:hypothetical protein